MRYFTLLLIFVFSFYPFPEQNQFGYRIFFGLIALSVGIAIEISFKYHYSLSIAFLSIILFGLFQLAFQLYFYSPLGELWFWLANFNNQQSLFILLMFACVLLCIKDDVLRLVMPLLLFIAIGDSCIMIFRFFFSPPSNIYPSPVWWVLSNPALDASFLACTIPLSLDRLIKIPSYLSAACLSLILSAIFMSKSNTGIFATMIGLIVYFIFYPWLTLKNKIVFISLFSMAFFSISKLAMSNKFMVDSGRFAIWQKTLNFWNDNANLNYYMYPLGIGPGTFSTFSMQVSSLGEKPGYLTVFPWVHNDYLQILFENGIIGLASAVFVLANMIKRALKKPKLLSQVVTYAFISITQFPLRVFTLQLLGLALIFECFHKDEVQQKL